MPNAPIPAARKRTPLKHRRNAQSDHEGSPHRPDEFDQSNAAKQVPQDAGHSEKHRDEEG